MNCRGRQDFVVATWCDVERAQGRVVAHLTSSYIIQVLLCLIKVYVQCAQAHLPACSTGYAVAASAGATRHATGAGHVFDILD